MHVYRLLPAVVALGACTTAEEPVPEEVSPGFIHRLMVYTPEGAQLTIDGDVQTSDVPIEVERAFSSYEAAQGSRVHVVVEYDSEAYEVFVKPQMCWELCGASEDECSALGWTPIILEDKSLTFRLEPTREFSTGCVTCGTPEGDTQTCG